MARSRDARRVSEWLLVNSYIRHCSACMSSKILYLVERESRRKSLQVR